MSITKGGKIVAQDILDNLAKSKSTYSEITLLASGWSGNSQNITIESINGETNGIVVFPENITDNEVAAVKAANLYISAQSDNTLTFTCKGTVPTIDVTLGVFIFDTIGHISSGGGDGSGVPSDTVTLEQLGGVPVTRTINGKPLSTDIVLTYADVGAAPLGEDGKIPVEDLPDVVATKEYVDSLISGAIGGGY